MVNSLALKLTGRLITGTGPNRVARSRSSGAGQFGVLSHVVTSRPVVGVAAGRQHSLAVEMHPVLGASLPIPPSTLGADMLAALESGDFSDVAVSTV